MVEEISNRDIAIAFTSGLSVMYLSVMGLTLLCIVTNKL